MAAPSRRARPPSTGGRPRSLPESWSLVRWAPGRPSFARRFGSTAAGAGLALIAPGAGPAVAGPLITAAGVAAVVAAVAVIRTLARRA
jgi:hypothetical protein